MRWRKLAIVAGGGDMPVLLAEHLHARNLPFWVARIAHYADSALNAFPGAAFNIGQTGARIDAMRAAGCDAAVFLGAVRRPDLAQVEFDVHGQGMLPRLIAAAREGDDAILRVLVVTLEEAGFTVIGAHEAMADLLAPAGALGALTPSEAHIKDIAKAALIADALNIWDVGQAVAVCDGAVLALEAQEGTDAMLARVASLPPEIRGTASARRGVLLKRPKPHQERRIDLPAIGVATLERAAEAGLAGIAVEAGGALIARRTEVAERADALGLFVYGFTAADLA